MHLITLQAKANQQRREQLFFGGGARIDAEVLQKSNEEEGTGERWWCGGGLVSLDHILM